MSQNNEKIDDIEKIDFITVSLDFLKIIRKMWLNIFVLILVGAAGYGAYSHVTYRAFYTASATFAINTQQEQLDGSSSSASFIDDMAAEQMVTTFPHVLTSSVLYQTVQDELGPEGMSYDIRASVVENTNLINISVRDVEPERAYHTLQSVIKNYPTVSELVVGKVNMKMLDETGIPTKVDNPKNLKMNVAKGALAGMAVGFCWVLFVALSRKTIRREEDCIKLINQKCLGSVPYIRFKQRSKKVKRHLNITDESIDKEFKESIRIIRNKVRRSAKEHSLKIILITSALAGEGKSTVAVNLALSMAREGKKVALVDGDFRNPSDGEILGMDLKKGLVDYLKGAIPLTDCIYPIDMEVVEEAARLLYIPVGTAVADGSRLLASKHMRNALQTLREKMDYVIVDSAPVGLLTDASILAEHADGVVFVVKKDFAKADHILSGIEHLSENNIHMIGCVLNGN